MGDLCHKDPLHNALPSQLIAGLAALAEPVRGLVLSSFLHSKIKSLWPMIGAAHTRPTV